MGRAARRFDRARRITTFGEVGPSADVEAGSPTPNTVPPALPMLRSTLAVLALTCTACLSQSDPRPTLAGSYDPEVMVFALQHVDAATVALELEDFMADADALDPDSAVRVEPDVESNSVIVQGAAERVTQVQALLVHLDRDKGLGASADVKSE